MDFEHLAKDRSFVVKADLTPCALLLGEHIHKKTGDKLNVEVTMTRMWPLKSASWDWARVGSSFHDLDKFGVLIFE